MFTKPTSILLAGVTAFALSLPVLSQTASAASLAETNRVAARVIANQTSGLPSFPVRSVRVGNVPSRTVGLTERRGNATYITLSPQAGGWIRNGRAEGTQVLVHERLHAFNWCASEGEVEAAAWSITNVVQRRLGLRDRLTYREWQRQNFERGAEQIVRTSTFRGRYRPLSNPANRYRIDRMQESFADC